MCYIIVSNHFNIPYYLNTCKEKGSTAYYLATSQTHLALFRSYALAYQFYYPSQVILGPCKIIEFH
ncbi:hypothetical protein B9T31_16675 [Acinetobacter sp. ANC 4558]|nr:hypothetical protein B9T31_16675 [Acinetobacter sp. ANC 4558]